MPKILDKLSLIALILFGSAAQASPDAVGVGLRQQLRGLEAALADAGNAQLSNRALLQRAGLMAADAAPAAVTPIRAGPGPDPEAQVEIEMMDARLALGMLAQAFGEADNDIVLAARATRRPGALVVRQGVANLADLRLFLDLYGMPALAGPRGTLDLRVPLLVMPDAALALAPGQGLRLSRTHGAFLVNMGTLRVAGAEISVTGPAAPASPAFVPFVATAGGGAVEVTAARVSGLGFGQTAKFSGFSVLGNGLAARPRASVIRGSRISDIVSLSVAGVAGIVVEDNRFRRMRGRALVLSAATGARVRGNIFHDGVPNNAIRVTDGSARGIVEDNVVLGGSRSGIVVDASSHATTIRGNTVWRRDGGGIKVDRADCALIGRNTVIDNRQKGIEVRTSQGTRVTGNRAIANSSAGLWVSAQDAGTLTYLVGNVVAANGAGMATASAGRMYLAGNDFSNQFPRFLHGDVARQSALIARDLKGLEPMLITGAGGQAAARPPSPCTDAG
ncbi:hypothetical protein GE300_04250 [Rhodobacteraceae bacterium 2CG4]|uniref:Periplasmic copper-binding protein NosD beta helix domain-containing protein n=1 Tax=Halovulum marinum TaxID=2662447 RepID=A0A6L5YWV6_9RHOB|nr:right-handed parallel beta-helix repeat-containing protein [Halovulum marinum]MSU88833.1 hypothetical protein [Halovulum marinum]